MRKSYSIFDIFLGNKILIHSIASVLRAGQTSYVMRRFELEPMLKYIEKYKITTLGVVPPLVIAIIMSPLSKKYSLRSVRTATCGAAPLGPGPQARFRNLLCQEPKATFNQVWGMTETSCIATMFPYPEFDDSGSVGRSLPCIDYKYTTLLHLFDP